MAEGLVIKIGADINDAISGLSRLQQQVAVFGGGVTKYVGNAEESFKKLKNSLSNLPNVTGQATTALTNFGRVVQDAPFGIIGIANNIDPLVQSFNKLRESTGSTSGAFKALIGQLTSPTGIALGISAVTSLLITYGDRLFGASAGAKELAAQTKAAADAQKQIITQLGQERAEVDKLIILINSENTTRGQKETILKKLQQISPQYFGDLKNEAGLVDKLTEAYKKYTASLVARSEIAVLTRQLDEVSASIVDLERKGATNQVIDLGIKRTLDGRLQTTKLLTKEQTNQLTLNTQLAGKERERQAILAQIAEKQGALADDLKIRPQDLKIKSNVEVLPTLRLMKLGEEVRGFIFKYNEALELAVKKNPYDIGKMFKDVNVDPFKNLSKSGKDIVKYFSTANEALGFSNLTGYQKDLALTAKTMSDELAPAFNEFVSSIARGENAFKAFGQLVGQVLTQVIQKLISTAILAALLSAIPGFGAVTNASGQAVGGFAGIFKSLLGFRADGGPVSGGRPYIVGERGPELFMPSVSGSIIPNNAVGSFMGGGMGSGGGRSSVLRGQDILLAYARTQRSQLRVNG